MADHSIRPSYTLYRHGGERRYRGAVRRRSDDGVIWECEHIEGHGANERGTGIAHAKTCAGAEWRRRFDGEREGTTP